MNKRSKIKLKPGSIYICIDKIYVAKYRTKLSLGLGITEIEKDEIILVLNKIDHPIYLFSGESQMPGIENYQILYNNQKYNLTTMGGIENLVEIE